MTDPIGNGPLRDQLERRQFMMAVAAGLLAAPLAAEVVRLKVDVIVAANTPAGRAALMATKKIPIVIPFMVDPVGDGFAATLAHPGGNVTGLTNESADLIGKRLQLFKEALPSLSRIGVVVD